MATDGISLMVENFDVLVQRRDYESKHGVTMCCVILNEEKEIKDFLEYHRPYFKSIIMIDGGSTDRTVEIATPLVDELHVRKFDGHYSNQANRIVEKAKTDWVFIVDCDERVDKKLLERMDSLIDQQVTDCYSIPRKNTVSGKPDEKTPVDYQDRLYRSYCRRIRPVHGEVVGYKNKIQLPATDGNFIIHEKSLDRHVSRNTMYFVYEYKFLHEMGEPGTQSMDSFSRAYPNLRWDHISRVTRAI